MDRGPRRAFPATTQERSQVHDVEIALSADGRILGIRDEFLHDSGPYDPLRPDRPLMRHQSLGAAPNDTATGSAAKADETIRRRGAGAMAPGFVSRRIGP